MEGVPTIQWAGTPIVIDKQDARCADEDVINRGTRVISIFVLEFPNDLEPVKVTVSGASEQLALKTQRCYGGTALGGEFVEFFAVGTWNGANLRGRWVASLLGDIDDDGRVSLPRVEIQPVMP